MRTAFYFMCHFIFVRSYFWEKLQNFNTNFVCSTSYMILILIFIIERYYNLSDDKKLVYFENRLMHNHERIWSQQGPPLIYGTCFLRLQSMEISEIPGIPTYHATVRSGTSKTNFAGQCRRVAVVEYARTIRRTW